MRRHGSRRTMVIEKSKRKHSAARKSRSSSVRRNATRTQEPKPASRELGWYERQPAATAENLAWAREAGKHSAPGYREKQLSRMDDARARYRDMPSPSRSPERVRPKSKSRSKARSKSRSRSEARSATRSPSPPDDPGERGLRQRTPLPARVSPSPIPEGLEASPREPGGFAPQAEAYVPVSERTVVQPQRERQIVGKAGQGERASKQERADEVERARGWSAAGSMPAARGSPSAAGFVPAARGSVSRNQSLSERARTESRRNRFAGVISTKSLSRMREDVPGYEASKRSLSAVTVMSSGRGHKRVQHGRARER